MGLRTVTMTFVVDTDMGGDLAAGALISSLVANHPSVLRIGTAKDAASEYEGEPKAADKLIWLDLRQPPPEAA